MVERSHQILPGNKIHAGLAADGGVHLSEHRRRNLHELDPTHVERGEQPGDVADDSATQCNDYGLPIRAHPRQLFGHALRRSPGASMARRRA